MANQKHTDWTEEVLAMADASLVERELNEFPLNNFFMLFTTKDENAAPMSVEYINARVFDPMRRGEKKLGPIWTEYFADKQELLDTLRVETDKYKQAARSFTVTPELHQASEEMLRPVFIDIARKAFETGIIKNFDELYQLLAS